MPHLETPTTKDILRFDSIIFQEEQPQSKKKSGGKRPLMVCIALTSVAMAWVTSALVVIDWLEAS